MTKQQYGHNATTGQMRPIAHAGELGGDEVLKVSYLPHACEPGGDEVLREGHESDRDWEMWKLRAQIDVLKADNERLRAMLASAPKPEDAQ